MTNMLQHPLTAMETAQPCGVSWAARLAEPKTDETTKAQGSTVTEQHRLRTDTQPGTHGQVPAPSGPHHTREKRRGRGSGLKEQPGDEAVMGLLLTVWLLATSFLPGLWVTYP